MRHQKHRHQLGVAPDHRKAMIKNLSVSFLEHKKIKSTRARCKALQSYVEKLITLAKVDSVHTRRLAFAKLNSKKAVKNLFEQVAPKYKERPGGYTRFLKSAEGRTSDGASMGYLMLVD